MYTTSRIIFSSSQPLANIADGSIVASISAACTAGVARPSHVLLAMGADPETARGSLRLTLGHTSTDADVDAALTALPPVVERARHAALAGAGGWL